RQPNLRVPFGGGALGPSDREPDPGRRRQPVLRVRGHHRGGAARHRARRRAARDVPGQRIRSQGRSSRAHLAPRGHRRDGAGGGGSQGLRRFRVRTPPQHGAPGTDRVRQQHRDRLGAGPLLRAHLMPERVADLVVVGGGTIGGWASYFAAAGGVDRVVLIERGTVGQGASSRAAGIVRAQGGTPAAVRLGRWSIEFYRRQRDEIGVDSGFREQGYLLLAVTDADVRAAHDRVEMQRELSLDVRWMEPDEAVSLNPTLAPGSFLGATYAPGDGCIDPPRNVLAYSLAAQRAGVEVRERTAFLGLRADSHGHVSGVETSAGVVPTERVILTGGPGLGEVGRAAGVRIPAGAVRHQVAVTQPHPDL